MITGRLVGLRPIEEDDLDILTALANDPRIRAMVVGWDWMVNSGSQKEWLHSTQRSATTRRLMVVDRNNGKRIGMTGLWDVDWHNRSALTAVKLLPDNGLKGAGGGATP